MRRKTARCCHIHNLRYPPVLLLLVPQTYVHFLVTDNLRTINCLRIQIYQRHNTPLHFLPATSSAAAGVRLLLERGAEVNANDIVSPIHIHILHFMPVFALQLQRLNLCHCHILSMECHCLLNCYWLLLCGALTTARVHANRLCHDAEQSRRGHCVAQGRRHHHLQCKENTHMHGVSACAFDSDFVLLLV